MMAASIGLVRVSAWISLPDVRTASQSCCVGVNRLPPSDLCLRMLQRFSIEMRSGEDGGHTMSCSLFMHEDDFMMESTVLSLKEPSSTLAIIPAQNMTRPCWRMVAVQKPSIWTIQGFTASSVNERAWKLVFLQFCARCSRFCCWGWIEGLCYC